MLEVDIALLVLGAIAIVWWGYYLLQPRPRLPKAQVGALSQLLELPLIPPIPPLPLLPLIPGVSFQLHVGEASGPGRAEQLPQQPLPSVRASVEAAMASNRAMVDLMMANLSNLTVNHAVKNQTAPKTKAPEVKPEEAKSWHKHLMED